MQKLYLIKGYEANRATIHPWNSTAVLEFLPMGHGVTAVLVTADSAAQADKEILAQIDDGIFENQSVFIDGESVI